MVVLVFLILNQVPMYQRKIIRMIFLISFLIKFFNLFYVSDLLKFCLRSLGSRNPTEYLNSLFSLKTFAVKNNLDKLTYSSLFCKTKTKLFSLTKRGSRLPKKSSAY